MLFRFGSGALLFFLILSLASCRRPHRQPVDQWSTVKVQGKVFVDGEPRKGVTVTATPDPGAEIAYPSTTQTDEDGSFAFATYRAGDGLPVGSFRLTFMLLKTEKFGQTKDLFKGRYRKPKESKWEFKVEAEHPVNLETINLTTQ